MHTLLNSNLFYHTFVFHIALTMCIFHINSELFFLEFNNTVGEHA